MSSARRYIAKCKVCNSVTSGLTSGNHMHRSKSDPQRDGQVYTYEPAKGEPVRTVIGSLVLDCRKCGAPKIASVVRGKFSTKHECNAKCLASTGTICECSCAGKNHGSAHAA